MKPEKLPDKSPKTELDAVFAELPNLRALTEIKPSAKSPYAKLMKQLLFDIGYSVSTNLPAFADRKVDQPKMRAALSDTYDTPAQEAVRAFQTHHFSGRRRAYNILNTAAEKSLPRAGTLDAATIEAILQHWFAAMTQTK
ncbi:MAG: hypothetical protein R3B70_06810 [Polyangiaceae bacterium]